MTLKFPKTNTLGDGLIERTSSVSGGIESCIKRKKVINRGKRSKTSSEVKPVENISKNPQSFLGVNSIAIEPFWIKGG